MSEAVRYYPTTVEPSDLMFGPGVAIPVRSDESPAWLARRVLVRVALEDVADEWLSAPWEWPPDRSVRLTLGGGSANYFPVGSTVAVGARVLEVFACEGEKLRCVPQ